MTDERRVEVAAEALRADGWTCEYHEPTARRGECSGCDSTLDASARAVVAALDAHDGELRTYARFIVVWGDAYLADDIALKLNCTEAGALIELLRLLGDDDSAETWRAAHAESDDECEEHQVAP